MESQRVLKFLAEVANLAAMHFGESPPPASSSPSDAQPRPPCDTETATAPTCSLCGEGDRRLHDFPQGRACSMCLTSAAPDALRAECDRLMAAWATENGALNAALTAERATTERLRRELADVQQSLQDGTRGSDVIAELSIDFSQMATGAVVPFHLDAADGARVFDVKVPAGVADGTRLRLRGQGGPGSPPGDILLTVRVAENAYLRRDGDDIVMHVPVPLDALQRGAMEVQAPTGPVSISLTPENLGKPLRLRGRGITPPGGEAGDLILSFDVTMFSNRHAFMWERFANAKEAFTSLRSLSSATRDHLMTLVHQSRVSTMHAAIREVIWALAVAHERGWREPRSGLSSDLMAQLIAEELLPSAHSKSTRSRVFAWLSGKTPLITKQPIPGVSLASWTVHFERMSEPGWTHAQPQRLAH